MPRKLRAALPWAGLAAIVVLAALLWRGWVRVEGTHWQPTVRLPFEVQFQPLDHPVLDELRRREKLDGVVAGEDGRFQQLVRLCHWTRRQWEPGRPDPYPPWNALAILDLIRAGKTGGFCGQYAQVFAQACLSFGWQARYLEIGPREDPCAHFTPEVWVDPLAKWVVLDPFNDVWFERAGRPLSGLEVHRALVTGDAGGVGIRNASDGSPVEAARGRRLVEAFYYLRFHRKLDHLSRPEAPFEWKDKVDWADAETVRWQDSPIRNPEIQNAPTAATVVKEADVFDFELNRVAVDVRADRFAGRVTLVLTHGMPGFSHYRVWVRDGEPRRLEGDRFDVPLERAPVHVEIVPVNARGAEGVPARLSVR